MSELEYKNSFGVLFGRGNVSARMKLQNREEKREFQVLRPESK